MPQPAQFSRKLPYRPPARIIYASLHQKGEIQPPLTPSRLNHFIAIADTFMANRPRYSWTLMAVLDAVAGRSDDLALQADTAWHLARAANAWVRPHLAREAGIRAEKLFQETARPGMAAAARWQQNALPWTRPNFGEVADILSAALAEMETAGIEQWLPDCRLSLAYAHLLLGNFTLAHDLIEAAMRAHTGRGDHLGQGRCLLTLSSCLRRQGEFNRAAAHLQEAQAIFEAQDAAVYQAQCYFQLGYLSWVFFEQYDQAERYWQQAQHIFRAADLPLWAAQCDDALAQLYESRGQLAEVEQALRRGRVIYEQYQIPGLLADNYLETSNLASLQGNLPQALAGIITACTCYTEVGNLWMVAVALSNQGHILARLGRFQQAFFCLEQAQEQLLARDLWQRVAHVELHMAHLLLFLGWPEQAGAYLAQAMRRYEEANIDSLHFDMLNLEAAIHMAENRPEEALPCLHRALLVARELGSSAGEGQSCRHLADYYCRQDQPGEAAVYLQQAEDLLQKTGMVQEQALCRVTWGNYYLQVGDADNARQSWTTALTLNEALLPEVAWQAHEGLAKTAATESERLAHYRQALSALQEARRNLWQPELVGSFLHQWLTLFDRAIELSIRLTSPEEVLRMVELSKAQIVIRSLQADQPAALADPFSEQLQALHAEIDLLRSRLRATLTPNSQFVRPAGEGELRQKLRVKIDEYAQLQRRRERRHLTPDQVEPPPEGAFSPALFEKLLNDHLEGPWLALDYYLTDDQLYVVAQTAGEIQVWPRPVTKRVEIVLQRFARPWRPQAELSARDLALLGEWLIPPAVRRLLSPQTFLLVAPHHQLHRLPWAALLLGGMPLVSQAIPIILPSLYTGLLLGHRPEGVDNRPGLLVGIAEYEGRHSALPQVSNECALLAGLLPPSTRLLRDQEATSQNLIALAQPAGLAEHFAFFHIAGHAFFEGHNGRVSGIAFHDRDFLLGELWDLAPLPPTVTLSACSGSQSRIYAGDEHISLVTTCLAAGAQRVIGSIWPVHDAQAPWLMHDFYAYLSGGHRPGKALALAQRAAISRNALPQHWGGFRCTGWP